MRRVVVTGLGTINPLGKNVKDSWDSLINSKSGLKNITTFDVNEYPCQIAGSIDPKLISEDIVSPREQRKIDRFITLGLIAAHEAFLDSGFEVNEENSLRSGVMVGSGIGGLDTIYKNSSILDNQGIRKKSAVSCRCRTKLFITQSFFKKSFWWRKSAYSSSNTNRLTTN